MDTITYDREYLIKIFKLCFQQLNSISSISKSDIEVYSIKESAIFPPNDFETAIIYGSKPLDAALYTMMPVESRPRCHQYIGKKDKEAVDKSYIHLGALIMFVLLRGGIPTASSVFPKVMSLMYSEDYSAKELIDNVSSFKLSKMNFEWLNGISLDFLPNTLRNRLVLGLPGHRYINVVRHFPPDTKDAEILQIRLDLLKYFGKHYYWDVFPLTRSKEFSEYFISFTKNMISFLSLLYSTETLDRLYDLRVIPVRIRFDERYTSFKLWRLIDFPALKFQIQLL